MLCKKGNGNANQVTTDQVCGQRACGDGWINRVKPETQSPAQPGTQHSPQAYRDKSVHDMDFTAWRTVSVRFRLSSSIVKLLA